MQHKILFATVLGIAALVAAAPAQAQQSQIKMNARQKSEFYNAPRRIQIVDERPLISDFREAPQAVGTIQMPPPPQGFFGPGGGQGGGALPFPGGNGGATPVAQLPAGQGILPYRTPANQMVPLDRVGFGRFSNIPAGGTGPRVALQNGSTTGVHATMSPFARPAQRPSMDHPRAIASNPRTSAPIASYGGPAYTQSPGGAVTSVNGMLANQAVRGTLLSRLK